MRIIQLGPVPPPHGGVSTNMLAIHQALLKAGHSSSIVDVTNLGRRQGIDNTYEPSSAFDLCRYLLKVGCDIVHYHIGGDFRPKLALLMMYCGILPGKKSVVTFHSGGFTRTAASTARPRSIRGAAFRSTDLVIGVNEHMIEMFKAYGVDPSRCKLIPPYELKLPDPETNVPPEFEGFVQNSKPFLLSIGALEPEYLNSKLIDAMPALMEARPNAGLMIVGSGSQRAEIEKYVRSRGLTDRVKLAGNVDREVVLRLITSADLVLRVTEYDGDAISIREALYLGTPVAASDNVPRPDGVFLLSRPFAPEAFLSAVEKAERGQFSGPSSRDNGTGNAAKVIEEYKQLLDR